MEEKKKINIGVLLALVLVLIMQYGCASTGSVNHNPDYDVIVIGAGLGGLSAGAHLAANNLKVLVLEQHDKVGGCATRFERGAFTFEASLHEMAGGGPGKYHVKLYSGSPEPFVDETVKIE